VADQGHQRLRQVLALEREALRRVQALLAECEEDDPYRVVLERHRDNLADAIADLERLVGRPPLGFDES
jgi:hypothetical protein